MEAVFRMKADEFDDSFINQMKALLKSKKSLELTITIADEGAGILRKETREQYFSRLEKAMGNLDKEHGVSFNAEEFESFSNQLLNEP